MVSSSKIESSVLEKLHLDKLPNITKDAFLKCVKVPFFSIGGWYLAGGTALALQIGHRQSIAYPFFCAHEPLLKVGTVSILKPQDIAAMKIVAISQRGKKRDFFDLYWISLHIQPLSQSIESAQKQYSVAQNPNHILKSLVYFEDAEEDADPKVYFNATWKEVKKFFTKEIKIIADKLIR